MSYVRTQLPDSVSEWFRISNFAVEQDSVSEGAKHLFSQVRKDASHLSKTVSGLFGRYDYSALEDKTNIFFTKYFLLN